MVFTVAAFTRVYVRNSLSIGLAEEASRKWLEVVSAGRLDEALEMMSRSALMRLQPSPLGSKAPPAPFDSEMAVDILREDPLLHAVQSASKEPSTQFRFAEGQFFWISRDPQVSCRFEAAGGHVEQLEFSLVLTRRLSPQNDVVWLVDSWTLLNPTAEDLQASHQH